MSRVIDNDRIGAVIQGLRNAIDTSLEFLGQTLEREAKLNTTGERVLPFWKKLTEFTLAMKGSSTFLFDRGFLANALTHIVDYDDNTVRIGIYSVGNPSELLMKAKIHELGGHTTPVILPTLPFVIPFAGREQMRKWFFAKVDEFREKGLLPSWVKRRTRGVGRPQTAAIRIPPRPFLAPPFDMLLPVIPQIIAQIINNMLDGI